MATIQDLKQYVNYEFHPVVTPAKITNLFKQNI